MPSLDAFGRMEYAVLAVLPDRAHDLARLRALTGQTELSTVTVIGKYNHGKSRLLNELIGQDVFAVADKRETVHLKARVQGRVRWLDAPGLDADVAAADDRCAMQAAWLQSDIRLFVHSAKEGELDAQEHQLLQQLRADSETSRRQMLLIASQVDQLPSDAELNRVLQAIALQAQGMPLYSVSAARHRQGAQGSKKLLVERSGIPILRAALEQALQRVPAARLYERTSIHSAIQQQLRQRHSALRSQLDGLQQQQAQQRQEFDQDLRAVFDKAKDDLAEVMSTPGPDLALQPDTAADKLRLTSGRLERARVQVAYSKVCIQINAVLTRHGAIELPAGQQTIARSLNSVMVAVLGVSVKYRQDLRRMFYEQAGRESLQHDFARYYEMSSDRQTLAAQIADTHQHLAAFDQARAAVQRWETGA